MKNKRLIALMSSAFLLSSVFVASPVKADVNKNRIYGNDRYETACEVSKNNFGSSNTVVIARGDDYADALCAAPLAKELNAPILLTQTNTMSEDVLKEIERLKAKDVVIVGGEGAVSTKVEEKLKSRHLHVRRVYGKDRYKTSIEVAKELKEPSTIVVTTGKNYADALSISPIAAKMNMPIILNDDKTLSKEANDYIKANKIKKSYVLAGKDVVSEQVEKELPGSERIKGNDRFETNLAVLKKFENQLDFNKIYLTKGLGEKSFADGLVISAVASRFSSPLVLAGDNISNEIREYIKNQIKQSTEVIGLGSETIVSNKTINSLLQCKNERLDTAINDSIKYMKTDDGRDRDDIITLAMVNEQMDQKTVYRLINELKHKNPRRITLAYASKSVLLALALKKDVRNFEGVNLEEMICKLYKKSNGFVNHKIWAVIAFEAAGIKYDKEAAYEYLKSQQQKDGGFSWAEGAKQSDIWPDMTAMAVYSLSMMGKTKDDKVVADALKYLKNSLPKLEKNKNNQSVESLAQIAMAAVSVNDDLSQYRINGNNIIDEILTYKVKDDGFKHVKYSDRDTVNSMATWQAAQALLFYKYNKNLFAHLK